MIREVNEEEIRRIGLMLWSIKNSCSWESQDEADIIPRALCSAIVSQIAYCYITDDERERANRAKIVPSDWHHQLIWQERIDIVEILARSDIPNLEIYETRNFVVISFKLNDIVFIGIRGTQFAYDWLKNIRIIKKADVHFRTGARYHGGFYKEAAELDQEIAIYFEKVAQEASSWVDLKLCICGHSLGGAISALVLQSYKSHRANLTQAFCNIFGAPRIASATDQNKIAQPIAFRTALDIVPHCPPRLAGYYANFLDQRDTRGNAFAGTNVKELTAYPLWLRKLLVYEGVKNHSIEIYRSEIRDSIRPTHPRIDKYIVDIENRSI